MLCIYCKKPYSQEYKVTRCKYFSQHNVVIIKGIYKLHVDRTIPGMPNWCSCVSSGVQSRAHCLSSAQRSPVEDFCTIFRSSCQTLVFIKFG